MMDLLMNVWPTITRVAASPRYEVVCDTEPTSGAPSFPPDEDAS
jgi:hypothetical protein